MHEVAWAAGLFEGEGSAVLARRADRTSGYLRVLSLPSTDLDVLERFQRVVGGGTIVAEKRRLPNKPLWRWRTTKWSEINRIGRLLLPWLMTRRRAAMELLLANPARATGRWLVCRRGHPLVPDNVYANGTHRQCKRCSLDGLRRRRGAA